MVRYLIIGLLALMLYGCDSQDQEPLPKYQVKEMVQSVLTKQPGQILRRNCYYGSWRYLVRLRHEESRTVVSLLGADGPIARASFTRVRMYEFELEPLKEGE